MMAFSDLVVRQAKAAEKTYSIPETDGLGLVVTPTGGNATTGSASRSASPWAPILRLVCVKHAPCVMKPGRYSRKVSILMLTVNISDTLRL